MSVNPKILTLVMTHTKALQQAGNLIGSISRIQLSSCIKCSMCSSVATFRKGIQYACDHCEAERRVKTADEFTELESAEDIRLLQSYVEALDIGEDTVKLQS